MTLIEQLEGLPEDIRVAIVGIGSIGKGIVYQSVITPGIRPVVIADIRIEKAIQAAELMELDFAVVDNVSELEDCIRSGKVAVCDSGELAASTDLVQVFIEASNALVESTKMVLTAIAHGQHIVMMNYESEMMFGPYLLKKANEAGVIYTCADGDQPATVKLLVDEIRLWGFDLVMAGNIKGYMDRYTDPEKIKPEADKRELDAKMCSSYTDGSKLCVEQAVMANALNLRTDVPGMHGPKVNNLLEMFDHFDFEKLYRDKQGVVDYVLGAEPRGGVFVIGYTESKLQKFYLDWFPSHMGPGPFYLFYRPYHLGHIEVMASVADAFINKTARMQPVHGMKTNVFSYAKKDLKAGDMLDGIGGFAAYGLIENLADNLSDPGIPICIAENMRLKRPLAKDQRISLQDVEMIAKDPAYDLYLKACAENYTTLVRKATRAKQLVA